MLDNQTDRLQQLEDVMIELQSLRTGTNVKSMIVVQSDDPVVEAAPPAMTPTLRFNNRMIVGIGATIVVLMVGMLLIRNRAGNHPNTPADVATRLAQLKLATAQATTGDAEAALLQVESLTDADCTPAELLTAAAAFACASTRSAQDQTLAEHRAARAVLFLRRAVAQGFKDVNDLRANRDLATLQGRADFKKLIAELNLSRQ